MFDNDVFVYDPTQEDKIMGYPQKPKDKHLVLLDDGTYKWIPNDEIEF